MELRLDMCQKLIPYIYKTVTLETASHGSLVGNPVQTDIMRSVLTVLLPNGQMDIPLDDILSISCFGMETLRFDNAASAQPAAPAVPTTPAPVPSSPVAPAAPPVAEEPVAAPEPVNPLELAPKKEPQKQLTELLIDGDLSAALALATEPEALQHQGYTEEETAQITAQLRAGMEKTAVLLCIGRPGLSQFYLQYRWLPGRQYPAGKHLEKLRCSLADDRNERLPLHRTVLPRHGGSGRLVDLQ